MQLLSHLNELLLRLSPRFDSNPELFASYGMTLQAVSQGVDVEASLRRFELELLNQLGYQINWKKDFQNGSYSPSFRKKRVGWVNNSNSFLDYRNNTGSCRISYIKIKVVNDFKN